MKKIIKDILRPFYKTYKKYRDERAFRAELLKNKDKPLNIVIGSSGKYQAGWIPSEASFLNLLKENDWNKYFRKNEIDCLLAEHVWEHLTLEEGRIAAGVCFRFLKKGGRLRVAVPDGYHKNQDYIEYVRPGGTGAGADDHKVLYNYELFSSLLEKVGFTVKCLEYFDAHKDFHAINWSKEDGFIHRSIRYDERNANGNPNYTSLILDAIKN